jgi:hypothetical protein
LPLEKEGGKETKKKERKKKLPAGLLIGGKEEPRIATLSGLGGRHLGRIQKTERERERERREREERKMKKERKEGEKKEKLNQQGPNSWN